MSASLVYADGKVRQLDKPASGRDRFTPDEAKDADKLARKVQDLEDRLAKLERGWMPRQTTFVDQTTTGTALSPQTLRFPHGFGGRVWYSVLSASGAAMRLDYDSTNSTNDTLVLASYSTGTFSIRIEESG